MRAPRHFGESNGYYRAGKNCKPLQRERHAIFPATHSQVCELQLPLLVQMFSLEVDQVTLIPQESSRFGVHSRCGWGFYPVQCNRDRCRIRRLRSFGCFRPFRFRLFCHLCIAVASSEDEILSDLRSPRGYEGTESRKT